MYRPYLARVGRTLRQVHRLVLVHKADIPLRRLSSSQNHNRLLCDCVYFGNPVLNLSRLRLRLFSTSRAMSSSAAGGAAPGSGNVNRLAMEKSPYLLQHATNPVDWYPWGQEAFTKAKKEDKLIFLSVGYSTCHWCHVMERESFESAEIGKIMSDHFVNIKVDREERPDVDKIYMSFVHATTGGGGWPMSVWMTPDLKPIVGGTYFPPDNKYYDRPGFKSVLLGIAQKWKEERDKMDEQGTIVVDALMRASASQSASRDQVENIKCIDQCFTMLRSHYDEDHGGIGTKPKFPQPANFNFLLRHYADHPDRLENKVSLKMVTDTLQSMAKGGIHDHINKGFHRYSTDQVWHVPHFEKMLYDQAQLAVLYAETFQVTRDKLFADVTRDILEYVSRDLTDPNGGFYSAEDADSLPTVDCVEKKEGAFCVWTSEHLGELLCAPVKDHEQLTLSDVFQHHYGAKKLGNVDPYQDPHDELKGQNVLIVKGSVQETAERFCLTVEETKATLDTSCQILFEERKKRPPPHLDNKMITAWNGLMISGFAKAGQILDDQNFTTRATKAAQFIKAHMYNPETKKLLRSVYVGDADSVSQIQSPIPGFADDYAFLIRGLLDLYEAGQEEEQLAWAEQLQETQNELFWDMDSGGYFNTAQGDPSIIMRLKEDHDGAEPSANSVSASNLLRLSYLLDRADWRHLAVGVLAAFAERLEKVPAVLPEMVTAHMMLQGSPKQIIIAGDRDAEDTRALLQCVHSHFLPNKVLILADGDPGGFLHGRLKVLPTLERLEGKATAYMCENYSCSLPVNSVGELEELLKE